MTFCKFLLFFFQPNFRKRSMLLQVIVSQLTGKSFQGAPMSHKIAILTSLEKLDRTSNPEQFQPRSLLSKNIIPKKIAGWFNISTTERILKTLTIKFQNMSTSVCQKKDGELHWGVKNMNMTWECEKLQDFCTTLWC